jgi:hypothetical protein
MIAIWSQLQKWSYEEKEKLAILKKWMYILHNENNIIQDLMKTFLNSQIL